MALAGEMAQGRGRGWGGVLGRRHGDALETSQLAPFSIPKGHSGTSS